MPRMLEAGLGPGGRRAAAGIALLAGLRAVGLVLVAEGLAGGVVAIQDGGDIRIPLLLATVGIVLRAFAVWATSVLAARGARAVRAAARSRLTARLLDPAADRVGAGEAAQLAANGLDALDEYFAAVVPAVVSAIVVPLALGAWTLWRDWPSAIVLAVTVPLVPAFMILIGLHTRERVAAAQEAIARLADRMLELARGLPVIVGLGRDAEQTESLARIQDESRRRTMGTLRTAFLSSLALELVSTLSVAVVAVMLGVRLLDGSVALGAALVVLVLAPEIFGALRDVGTAFHASQDGLAALRRLEELTGPAVAPGSGAVVETNDGLAVAGLTVRHPDRAVPALDRYSAWFPRGRVTALVGPSGAGKSTLLAAIAQERPGSVAFAPQAPAFATDRVRAELALYGVADAEALLGRLGAAWLAEEDPAQLSPGEQRLVAVAAAVAVAEAGATVVLLDEPTAHLDAVAAAAVRSAILAVARDAVVVVATHDPACIELADRIVEVPPAGAASSSGERAPELARAPSTPFASRGASATPARAEAGRVRSEQTPPPAPSHSARLGAWALGILLGLLAAGSGLALAAVSGWLIVRASEVSGVTLLLVASVGVRFFGLARAVARYAERLVVHRAVLATTDSLRLRLWSALAARGAASRRLLAGGSTADLLVARLAQLREELPRAVVPGAVGMLVLLGVIITAFAIDPASAPWVSGLLLAAVATGALVLLPLQRATAERGALRADLARRVAGLGEAGPVLAANGAAARAAGETDRLAARLGRIDARVARRTGAASAAATAGVLAAALAAVAAGGAGAPAVAALALLAMASLDPILGLLGAGRHIAGARSAWAVIRPALVVPPPVPSGASGVPERGGLALERLAGRWPDADVPAFEGLDAEVAPGEWLLVTGRSGSGKSTLLTVLLARLAAAAGSASIGGVAIPEADAAVWRASVGWCPQEAHVFDSTIRGNLLLARPAEARPDDAELSAVLREVGLGRLLDTIPDGLDTRVGAAGRSLSGGERQRLAVARALIGGAHVLLLDEPTAHLDAEGAHALLRDLRRATRDRVVVLVTHHPEEVGVPDAAVDLGQRAFARMR